MVSSSPADEINTFMSVVRLIGAAEVLILRKHAWSGPLFPVAGTPKRQHHEGQAFFNSLPLLLV
jgi:hypothetical protein